MSSFEDEQFPLEQLKFNDLILKADYKIQLATTLALSGSLKIAMQTSQLSLSYVAPCKVIRNSGNFGLWNPESR